MTEEITPPSPNNDAADADADDRAPPGGARGIVWNPIRPRELLLVLALGCAILLPGLASYSLIAPWEGHYGEVARRMLEEGDWVKLRWQNEDYFRSKPGLTFWVMATSLSAHGVATDGGYSGEMVASALPVWALRLPFALFGVLGVTLVWLMLAKLATRRIAWLGWGIVITTPFYALVSRQAITDIPMVATTMGAISCFLIAFHAGERELRPIWKKLNAYHIFLAGMSLLVALQLARIGADFAADPSLGRGVRLQLFGSQLHPGPLATLPFLAGLVAFAVLTWWVWPTRYVRQVYMYWAYLLVAVSVLAKGPPGAGVVVIVCGLVVVITRSWGFILRASLLQGIAIMALVGAPWHVAMALKDGRPWVSEYFGHHWFKRASRGVHGERGTFNFYVQQIGIGAWPWIALFPAAIAAAFRRGGKALRHDQVRLAVALWAFAGFAFFSMVETKFHHYILPALPAFGLLVAFWIDDVLEGRARRQGLLLAVGAGLILFIVRDLIAEQKQIIELFVYRYDRPWPSGPPWSVDVGGTLLGFALAFSAIVVAMIVPRIRRWALAGFGVAALAYAYWVMNGYMGAAAPHWGQRHLHETYYAERAIHGVDILYYGLRDLHDDWHGDGATRLEVRSVLPEAFEVGQPAAVHIEVPDQDLGFDLSGTVAELGDDRFWIEVPAAEKAKLAEPIARGKTMQPARRRPWRQVNADRLIAWQLNWRDENFWSGGEIWGRTKDTQTVFVNTDNKQFLEYVKDPSRRGRTFFLITEAGRADGLRNVLPTETAKRTVEKIDTTSNKFTLLSFTL